LHQNNIINDPWYGMVQLCIWPQSQGPLLLGCPLWLRLCGRCVLHLLHLIWTKFSLIEVAFWSEVRLALSNYRNGPSVYGCIEHVIFRLGENERRGILIFGRGLPGLLKQLCSIGLMSRWDMHNYLQIGLLELCWRDIIIIFTYLFLIIIINNI
jgi:hypothetical protein